MFLFGSTLFPDFIQSRHLHEFGNYLMVKLLFNLQKKKNVAAATTMTATTTTIYESLKEFQLTWDNKKKKKKMPQVECNGYL